MRGLLSESVGFLRRNSFWLLSSRITAQAFAVIFIAIAARRLDISNFGQFIWLSSVLLIGNTCTTFGTDTLLIREVAKSGQSTGVVRQAFTLQLLFSVLWWFTTFVLGAQTPLVIYSLSLFPLAVISILSALVRAFERMDLFWVLTLINGLAQLISVLLSKNLYILCVALLIGNSITALLGLWVCKSSLKGISLLPLVDPRPLIQPVLPFALLTMLSVISQRLGVLTVSSLEGDLSTGLFSAASRIVEGLKLGHYAILGTLLPALSRGIKDHEQKFNMALTALLGFSSLLAVIITLTARPILIILFGDQYASATELLMILVWTLVPYTFSAAISVNLVVRGMEMKLVRATAISLIIFILLYLCLIPIFQLKGAVYAALIGEVIQAVILISFQRKGGVTRP